MKELEMSSGNKLLLDDEDYEFYKQFNIHQTGAGYAVRNTKINGKRKQILIHREILNAPKNQKVDHRNGNILDLQRHNLRFATTSQNAMNRKLISVCNTSGYKGVHYVKRINKWMAAIRIGSPSKKKYLGYHDTPEKAASAYNEAAKKHFGEFAKLNIL